MTTPSWTRRLIPVLHHDAALLAVVKPAGIDTGSYTGRPTVGVQELLEQDGEFGAALRPVNRLSRYESGILLLAKSDGVARTLRNALHARSVVLDFVAVVRGRVKGRRIEVDAVHGASRGRERPKRARAGRVSTTAEESVARTAIEVLRAEEDRMLVRCRTRVENTHALRAQLRAAGLHLLGDRVPGKFARAPRHAETCLHLTRLSFPHPEHANRITLHNPPPLALDAHVRRRADWSRPLHAALVRRLPLLRDAEINAFRLLSGHAEDLPGVIVERWSEVLIVKRAAEAPVEEKTCRAMAAWYRPWFDVRTVVLRHEPPRRATEDDDAEGRPFRDILIHGSSLPAELVVHENNLKFLIRPEQPSPGLYLDQRDNRRRLHRCARDKDVLNLFAYTCGFSVAAAAGGACKVVSVDLSPRSLEWGKKNFVQNGLHPEEHLFVAAHFSDFLKRAARAGETFDLLVIDPPSFAHGRRSGQDFSVERDLSSLLADAAPLLRPGGQLLVSMNLRRLSWRALRERVRRGLSTRKILTLRELPLPPDFAVDPDHAKSLWITVE